MFLQVLGDYVPSPHSRALSLDPTERLPSPDPLIPHPHRVAVPPDFVD